MTPEESARSCNHAFCDRLFVPLPCLPELFSEFFVDLFPVADRENPDHAVLSVDFIDDAKASYLVFPQAA